MNVMGLDLSLTCTGVVVMPVQAPEAAIVDTVEPKSVGAARIIDVRTAIAHVCVERSVAEVALEGLSFGSKTASADEIAGLSWAVRVALHELGIPVWIVAPGTLKKLVAGSGNAKKDQMRLAVFKRWAFEHESNDVVDAYSLVRALRGHHVGHERKSDAEAWTKATRFPAIAKGSVAA